MPAASPLAGRLGADLRDLAQALAFDNPEALRAVLRQAYPTADRFDLHRLELAAARGELPLPERVRRADRAELKGANALYDHRDGGTALLADDLAPDHYLRAFAEEAGHHLDRWLGGQDSTGDERSIFADGLLGGGPLDAASLAAAQADDSGISSDNGIARQQYAAREAAAAAATATAEAAAREPTFGERFDVETGTDLEAEGPAGGLDRPDFTDPDPGGDDRDDGGIEGVDLADMLGDGEFDADRFTVETATDCRHRCPRSTENHRFSKRSEEASSWPPTAWASSSSSRRPPSTLACGGGCGGRTARWARGDGRRPREA